VSVPKKLTRDQRHALEALAKALPPDKFEPTRTDTEDKGIFDRVKDIFG
jgi:DnaJ-class molecular chaperone